MFRLRELVDARRDDLAALDHRRARQGARRRPGRGRPRPRLRRVRVRHPAPAQGRTQLRGLDRHRRAHGAAAGRRRRGHHAVQLPGDGAAVDARQRARLRQRVRAQAVGEGPVGVAAARRAGAARPGSPTACTPSCRATPKRSTRCSTHPDVDAVSFVGSTRDRAPRLRDRRQARQAGPGARRREEPHGRAARRRPRRRRRRRHLGRLRLGGGALHGDLGGRRGGRGRRSAGRGDRGAHPRRRRRSRRRRRVDDGTAHHERAPRPRAVVPRARRPTTVPRSWSTARR